MQGSARSPFRKLPPAPLARPLMRRLDPREVSRANEVMGARAEGGEVSAVARGKDEAGEEMGEGKLVLCN
jgi:hypothetical protein